MVGRFEDDVEKPDYLQGLVEHFAARKADGSTKVTFTEIVKGNKLGGASADLRCCGDTITIDHATRQLVIRTGDLSSTATEIWDYWRKARGPKLRDRTPAEVS